jgi:anaerobic selenocysteine-containing dehydrogenase
LLGWLLGRRDRRENSVWTRQEPVFDSPLNLGAHCAKGASVREHRIHEHSMRIKTPVKLVNGKYQKISWDQALDEISKKMLDLKRNPGPMRSSGWGVPSTQRAVVSLAQVRVVLGHQQLRPPGAHLPLDDGRRRPTRGATVR